MKVIKKADVSNWSYRHTCMTCESELQVEQNDLRYYRYDGDVREPGYDSFTATCSVCNTQFTVPTSKIPKLIQVEVKKAFTSSGSGYWDR